MAEPTSANPSCPICKGTGSYHYDVPIDDPRFSVIYTCECRIAQVQAGRLAKARLEADLPPEIQGMTFENFVPGRGVYLKPPSQNGYEASRVRHRIQKLKANKTSLSEHLARAKAHCQKFAGSPHDFLTLMGEPGSGKTHLAAAIANDLLSRGQVVQFSVVPDLLDYLRSTYNPKSEVSYDERLQAYKQVPLLILDDLGTEHTTTWASEKLYQLINHRYNYGLPMVITTNEVPLHLDLRLQSRLFDRHKNTVFEILAGDYRTGG